MSESVTKNAACAIMNGHYIGDSTDVPVPFSRAELYRAYRSGLFLFFIPHGSLGAYPSHLHAVLEERDFRYEQDTFRAEIPTKNEFVLAFPRLHVGTEGLPLREQQQEVHSRSILSPYEVASMYGLFHSVYPERTFFSGQARTEYEVGIAGTHLHANPLTIIVSSRQPGTLKLGKGYTTQVSPELGVMTGVRRSVG